jgi:hypothetical protein
VLLWPGWPRFNSWQCNIFPPPQHPDQLWGPHTLLFIGNRGFFSGGKGAWAWSWPLTSFYAEVKKVESVLNMKLLKSKKFFTRLNITTSNTRAFKEFLHPLSVNPNFTSSWHMHVICTSKGVMKMLGCALSIEEFGLILVIV